MIGIGDKQMPAGFGEYHLVWMLSCRPTRNHRVRFDINHRDTGLGPQAHVETLVLFIEPAGIRKWRIRRCRVERGLGAFGYGGEVGVHSAPVLEDGGRRATIIAAERERDFI